MWSKVAFFTCIVIFCARVKNVLGARHLSTDGRYRNTYTHSQYLHARLCVPTSTRICYSHIWLPNARCPFSFIAFFLYTHISPLFYLKREGRIESCRFIFNLCFFFCLLLKDPLWCHFSYMYIVFQDFAFFYRSNQLIRLLLPSSFLGGGIELSLLYARTHTCSNVCLLYYKYSSFLCCCFRSGALLNKNLGASHFKISHSTCL